MSPSSVCGTGEADAAHLGIKLGPPAAWMPRPSIKQDKGEQWTFTHVYSYAYARAHTHTRIPDPPPLSANEAVSGSGCFIVRSNWITHAVSCPNACVVTDQPDAFL